MKLTDRLYYHRFCCDQGANTIYETPLDYVVKLEKRSTRKIWFRYRKLKLNVTEHLPYYEFLKKYFVPTRKWNNGIMYMHDSQILTREYMSGFITKSELDDLIGYEVRFVKFNLPDKL